MQQMEGLSDGGHRSELVLEFVRAVLNGSRGVAAVQLCEGPLQRSRVSAQAGWEDMERRKGKRVMSRAIRRGQKR